MKQLLYIAILLCALWSCSDSRWTERLLHIESIIDASPDSALALLQTIDCDSLSNDQDKALYGMLYTEALDKNHEPIPDDSLISFAAQYFSDHNDKRRSMIALNYKGRVQYMNASYAQALVSFMEAHELANEFDDKFWIGMTARGIADIYNESFNSTEALTYALKEYNYIKESERQPYINYAMLDLANAQSNNGQYAAARTLCEIIIDSATVHSDAILFNLAQRLIGTTYLGEGLYCKALPIFKTLCNSDMAQLSDSISLAWAYAERNHPQEAFGIISQIKETGTLQMANTQYRIFKALNQTDNALQELEKIDILSNQIFRQQVNRNLTGSIVEYFDLNKRNAATELKATRTRMWLIYAISALVITLLGFTSYYIYSKQRQELYNKLMFADQLQELLRQSKAENTKSSTTIQYLLSSKYELLEDLCSIVMRYTNNPASKHKIADSVTSLLENLSIQSERIVALEKHVDKIYNNVFTSFRQDLPSLKEVDYRLFLFIVLGLSNTAISLLLKEEKISAIYERKRRLKEKIKELEPEKNEWYTSFF